ncbi:class I SAM-dependent methyltransferase [Streptomyces olindensis]|uniref:class I SAM-dependent methyltransferase n=1 Tax=Streptomyces olindensis TaxID=358823 RepID=UPI00369C72F3
MTYPTPRDYGEQFAEFYDELFPKDAAADQVADALSRLVGSDGTALELGVGTGRIAIPLAQRIAHVTGVDVSPEMLDLLRDDVSRTGARVTAVEADLRTYADEQRYPLVYAVCGTLSMLVDADAQREAVRHAADRVAPGGHLVVETHNPPGILAMTGGLSNFTTLVPYPTPGSGLVTTWNINEATSLWRASHLWINNGSLRMASELSRLTTPEEIEAYATKAGLRPDRLASDWHGTPYNEGSPTYVATFTKPH